MLDIPHLKASSISDTKLYLNSVARAHSYESDFVRFRKCLEYREILEHVTPAQARLYIQEMRNHGINSDFLRESIRNLDSFNFIGNPDKYFFYKIGFSSPTLFRYLKVHQDLTRYFGSLKGFTVSELGGGFGGQCLVSMKQSMISNYIIYDLPPVLNLQRKFLNVAGISQERLSFFDGSSPLPCQGDLFLSNYAYSELTRSLQLQYLENVLQNHTFGYITWNTLSEEYLDGLSIEQLIKYFPKIKVVDENPETRKGNKIIYWNNL